MRTRAAHTFRPLLALAVLAVGCTATTGCTGGGEGTRVPETRPRTSDAASARDARVRAVARAWDGSAAAESWRRGYFPMAEAVQPPETGLRGEADRHAFETGGFVLRGDLPATKPGQAVVTWRGGGSVERPLLGARTAFEAMDRAGVRSGLEVTRAELGQTTVRTSRGEATVPAWLFTVRGYDTPVRRLAVAPSELPDPPIGPARARPGGELSPLRRLSGISDDGRTVTVAADHGSCDDGAAVDVRESSGTVVLAGYLLRPSDGPCDASLRSQEVTVRLDAPVADRVLLDASTGRPVPYGEPNGPSPSWSR